MTIRDRYVWVCNNRRPDGNPKGSCAQRGSEGFRDKLKAACNEAGLARSVRVMTSTCIDACEHGIVAAVMPENAILGTLTEEDIPALIKGLETAGGVFEQPTIAAKVIPRDAPASGDGLVRLGKKPAP